MSEDTEQPGTEPAAGTPDAAATPPVEAPTSPTEAVSPGAAPTSSEASPAEVTGEEIPSSPPAFPTPSADPSYPPSPPESWAAPAAAGSWAPPATADPEPAKWIVFGILRCKMQSGAVVEIGLFFADDGELAFRTDAQHYFRGVNAVKLVSTVTEANATPGSGLLDTGRR